MKLLTLLVTLLTVWVAVVSAALVVGNDNRIEPRQNSSSAIPNSTTQSDGISASAASDSQLAPLNSGTTAAGTPSCPAIRAVSDGIQYSHSNGITSACCAQKTNSVCFIQRKDKVSADNTCKIPSCAALLSGDSSQMNGFTFLTSTNGKGKNGNIFPSLNAINAAFSVPRFSASLFFSLSILISLLVSL